jgi:uncharacterized protein YciI
MKNLILFAILLCVSYIAEAQEKSPELRIRKYWFVMLTRGSNRTQDSATAAKLQQGHMANMDTMYYAGKLKVAGPFGDDGNWRGIFIFDCETKEEVEKLLAKDPAIAAGRLAYEIHPWYTEPSGNFKPGKPERKQ